VFKGESWRIGDLAPVEEPSGASRIVQPRKSTRTVLAVTLASLAA
jgi:hypothetical protein